MTEFKVLATRQSEDDVLFYFARIHGLHPNGPRAVMHALGYYGVEPVVVRCGLLRVRLTEMHDIGEDGLTFYEIATAFGNA